jgi:hypothetical protein
MADTRTPYERYSDFARTVAGIEPKSEEDWERDSNRAFTRLPDGASSNQIGEVSRQTSGLRHSAKRTRSAEKILANQVTPS